MGHKTWSVCEGGHSDDWMISWAKMHALKKEFSSWRDMDLGKLTCEVSMDGWGSFGASSYDVSP